MRQKKRGRPFRDARDDVESDDGGRQESEAGDFFRH